MEQEFENYLECSSHEHGFLWIVRVIHHCHSIETYHEDGTDRLEKEGQPGKNHTVHTNV